MHPAMLMGTILHMDLAGIKWVNKALFLARSSVACLPVLEASVFSTAHPHETSGRLGLSDGGGESGGMRGVHYRALVVVIRMMARF